jgi:outer membrane immunogenic protein
MMVRIGIFAAALITSVATAAVAADLPLKAPPMAQVPNSTWTGFYLGGNAGYGGIDPTASFTPNDPLSASITCGLSGYAGGGCPPATAFTIRGALAGVQAGYNIQMNQAFLIGLEADYDWSQIRGIGYSNFGLDFSPSTFHAGEEVTYFGTIRGRLGYLPVSKVLLFATGGLAYGQVQQTVGLDSGQGGISIGGGNGYNCSGGPNCFFGSSSHTSIGWTAGAGFEYALSSNLRFKAEYLFVDLGGGQVVNVVAQSAGSVSPPAAPSSFTAAYGSVSFQVLRAGINVAF